MAHEDTTRGQVDELLANNLYKVCLEGGRELVCHLSGRMRINHIRVVIGDKVEVVVDPYGGKTSNRIVKRL